MFYVERRFVFLSLEGLRQGEGCSCWERVIFVVMIRYTIWFSFISQKVVLENFIFFGLGFFIWVENFILFNFNLFEVNGVIVRWVLRYVSFYSFIMFILECCWVIRYGKFFFIVLSFYFCLFISKCTVWLSVFEFIILVLLGSELYEACCG